MSILKRKKSAKLKVATNTVALLMASVLDKLFFVMLMLYFARVMGAAVYGEYLSAMALIIIFRMLGMFGLGRVLVRDLARNFSDVNKYLSNSLSIAVAFSEPGRLKRFIRKSLRFSYWLR